MGVALRLRAVAVRLHVRRSVHRRIRFGRVADAHRMRRRARARWRAGAAGSSGVLM